MSDEFAPTYTTRERVVLLLKVLAIAMPILLLLELWFFDWLRNYAREANCHVYGDINGVHLLAYGVFVLIPLSSAFLSALLMGPRALRVLRAGQDPLPGEKVLRQTRYRYGRAARLRSYGLFAFILFFVGVSIWGILQAQKLTATIAPCPPEQLID